MLLTMVLILAGLTPVGERSAGCIAPSDLDPGTRFEQPTVLGVELYSWRTNDGLRYSMLWAINGDRREDEIKDPRCAIASLSELKAAMSFLAVGEHVYWRNYPRFRDYAFPEDAVMIGLREYCRRLGVTLYAPTQII